MSSSDVRKKSCETLRGEKDFQHQITMSKKTKFQTKSSHITQSHPSCVMCVCLRYKVTFSSIIYLGSFFVEASLYH